MSPLPHSAEAEDHPRPRPAGRVGCGARGAERDQRVCRRAGSAVSGLRLGTVATPGLCHPPPRQPPSPPSPQKGAQSKPESKEAGKGVRQKPLPKFPGVPCRQVPKLRAQHHGQRPRSDSGALGRRGLLAGLAAL